MKFRDVVKDIVLKHIRETAIFLVDVKIDSANRISVEIDRPGGVTIKECIEISRAIESDLNRDTEDFGLEVSSPGLTKPFKVLEQYQKNIGQQVEVVRRDGQKVNGLLQHADVESIALGVKAKNKETGKTAMHTVTLKFNEIKATKIALTF